ncbi:unnamed protein product [Brassica rapa subsp. narinosa]
MIYTNFTFDLFDIFLYLNSKMYFFCNSSIKCYVNLFDFE